ncbi:MAG: cobalt transport protein CbiN [Nitrospirae bacterium YQR-1]
MKIKIILLSALILCIATVGIVSYGTTGFTGTDDQAEQLITTVQHDYKPWIKPLWEPGRLEGVLFSVQILIGFTLIGYFLVFRKKKK